MIKNEPTRDGVHTSSSVNRSASRNRRNDNGAKTLSKLEDGERTVVATGTHYEMGQKATSVMQEWMKNEGFRWRKDGDPPVFESLKGIIALTTSVGYQHIYDPKYKTMRNMLGQVPLAHWQGWRDALGNDCEHGFTGTTIYVQPRVTANHGVNMTPKDNQELMETFRKAIAVRKSLGPEQELVIYWLKTRKTWGQTGRSLFH